jgi:tRNA G18 (ribose-2'-O)-methylase SpoU
MSSRKGGRQARRERRFDREEMLKRYEMQRRRNLLAEPGPYEFVVVLDHLKAGFNVPKIFRSAEAFGAREVHLIGIGPFDPAPAKGAFRKVPARFHDDFAACHRDLDGRGYTLFALDPAAPEGLPAAELPRHSAFVFGHEELGLHFDPADHPGLRPLSIPQVGAVESLNVAVAASIVMYEWVRRWG